MTLDVEELDVEEIVNGARGGDEALCLALRVEALHLSLSSPHRWMRILGSVVVAQSPRAMVRAAAKSIERRPVWREAVSHKCN